MFLGVDPGIRKLGFALIDKNKQIFELGALINEIDGGREDNVRRMSDISNFFDEILEKYSIKSVCIEKLFFTEFNKGNAEFVYGVRGLLMVKFYEKGINIIELSPKEIKKYITGSGNANKINMQKKTQKLFNLSKIPEPHDAADALGMAYIAKILTK